MKRKANEQKKSLKEISIRTLEKTSGGLTYHMCCGPGPACEGFYSYESLFPDWTDGSLAY